MSRVALRKDLTPAAVARALGFASVRAFAERAPDYAARGLHPDPLTGNYDPEAFERWRRLRNPGLFPELTAASGARNAEDVFDERLRRRVG